MGLQLFLSLHMSINLSSSLLFALCSLLFALCCFLLRLLVFHDLLAGYVFFLLVQLCYSVNAQLFLVCSFITKVPGRTWVFRSVESFVALSLSCTLRPSSPSLFCFSVAVICILVGAPFILDPLFYKRKLGSNTSKVICLPRGFLNIERWSSFTKLVLFCRVPATAVILYSTRSTFNSCVQRPSTWLNKRVQELQTSVPVT